MTSEARDPGPRADPDQVRLPGLSLAVDRAGREVVVALSGELDATTAAAARRIIETDAVERGGDVVLDLGAVTFIDSAGLVALARMAGRVREEGRRLVVANPTEFTDRLLRVTSVVDLVDIETRS
jgi:anti-sigma B factor antagonist